MSRRLDWSALMRAGMQGLRLTPEAFWALTPAELQMMLGTPSQAAPPVERRPGRIDGGLAG